MAHADLVVVKKISTAGKDVESVAKVKGDHLRIDSNLPGVGKSTVLVNWDKQQFTVLDAEKKVATKLDLTQVTGNAQAKRKLAGTDLSKAFPKATGEKENVAGHDCEIYAYDIGKGQIAKLWLTKDFPNYADVRGEYDKLRKTAAALNGFDADKFTLDGIAVKAVFPSATGDSTETLVSVKAEPIPDSDFEIPAGYREVTPSNPF